MAQPRPRWKAFPVSQDWKRAMLAALADIGHDKKWLADQIGCSPSAITTLLRETTKNSRLVIPICDVLGLFHPEYHDHLDQQTVENMRQLRRVDPAMFDRVTAQIARRLKESK